MLYRKIQPYIEDYLKSDSNKVLIIDGGRSARPLSSATSVSSFLKTTSS